MWSPRKSKSNLLVSTLVVLIALAVFALPQGICLKTILGDEACCSSLIISAASSTHRGDSCCQASRNDATSKGDSHSDSSDSDSGCMWTSTDPYVQASGHSIPDIASLEPVDFDWIRLIEIQLASTVAPIDFLNREVSSPALRRGSSILRI